MPIRALTDRRLSDAAVRVLGILCSYANRAGLTWVSQVKLAKDMGVTKQAISKQIVKLKAAGYVEVVKKGFKGERTDTVRVVFDESIDVETALAVTSRHEDNVKPVTPPAKEYQMPKGDTVTVAKMKAEIAAKKASKKRHTDNPEVVNQKPSIDNPKVDSNDNPEVDQNTKRTPISKSLRDIYLKDIELGLIKVLSNQLSENEQEATLQQLQARCQAEGVPMPAGVNLIEALLVLHADSL
jgi:DNA-binding transcriptional ArsR family regulator